MTIGLRSIGATISGPQLGEPLHPRGDMTRPASRLVDRATYPREDSRVRRGIGAAPARTMMKTIDANLLETILGSAGTNPAHLATSDGCPVPSAKNDRLAKSWNTKNGITKDKGGNFTKIDGPFPNLYRYEYANGSRCAPGADD
jgi:hypothetical protein